MAKNREENSRKAFIGFRQHLVIVAALHQQIRSLRAEIKTLKRQVPRFPATVRKVLRQAGFEHDGSKIPSTKLKLSPATQDKLKQLGPRLQETFHMLMTGETERTLAAKMAISPHTLHDYVKIVYAHFGASSRGTLFAQCMQTRHGMAITPAPPKPLPHKQMPRKQVPRKQSSKPPRLRGAIRPFAPGAQSR